MYSATPRSIANKWNDRPPIGTPCEISFGQQEGNPFPSNLKKSFKVQHRPRPSIYKRTKHSPQRGNSQASYKVEIQVNHNVDFLNLLRERQNIQPSEIPRSMTPQLSNFENTADRMSSLRKRLSPVKKQKRSVSSMDGGRQQQNVVRATFLNIQKLSLLKMYEEVTRRTEFEMIEARYTLSPPKQRPKNPDNDLCSSTVVEIKKKLRQSHGTKWVPLSKNRIRPFQIPFQRYYYKDFIWKVAFSNGLLLSSLPEDIKLKIYVGRGNNSQLVRSLIKRRNWWIFTEKWEQAHFVWTQLKINGYFKLQSQANKIKAIAEKLPKDISSRNQLNLGIMNGNDARIWDTYWRQNRAVQDKVGEELTKRNAIFKKQQLNLAQVNHKSLKIHNHMSQNFVIGNKKALLYTMRQYYQRIGKNVLDYLPLSFHVINGVEDPDYYNFLGHFYERKKKSKKQNNKNNIWIVKPGELTNRGNGIIVCLTLDNIKAILKRGGKHHDGTAKTFILQEYIERPFLYQRRKFDIRHYILVTSINGRFKGYWFKRGYIRTSSSEYTLSHGNSHVHLTNDAVQKNLPDYGKYEKGNKVSYQDFQAYLDKQYKGKYDFFNKIYPKMRQIATDAIRASALTLEPNNLQHNFQLFGLDFMIDGEFRPWLIECNSNPCLQLSCPLLASIIPALIENTLKICIDSLAAPPCDFTEKRPRFTDNVLASNQFQMVYDSVTEQNEVEGSGTLNINLNAAQLDREQDEQFEDDGQALED